MVSPASSFSLSPTTQERAHSLLSPLDARAGEEKQKAFVEETTDSMPLPSPSSPPSSSFRSHARTNSHPLVLLFSLFPPLRSLDSTTSARLTARYLRTAHKTLTSSSLSFKNKPNQQTAYRRAVASARRETTKRAPGAAGGGAAGSRGLSEEQKQEIRYA
jgi:hypothetical protein